MLRTNNRQSPDIFTAAENNITPDKITLNKLSEVLGKKHRINMEKYLYQMNGEKKQIEEQDDLDEEEPEE